MSDPLPIKLRNACILGLGPLAALLISLSATSAFALEPIRVGILKGDSLVVPVFRYANREWTRIQEGTVHDTARSDEPIKSNWHVFLAEPCYGPLERRNNDPSSEFYTGEAVDFFDGGYALRVTSPIPGSASLGPCNDTVVTSPIPVRTHPLEDLREDAFQWDRLLGLVLPSFERIESGLLKEPSSYVTALWPRTAAERQRRAAVFLQLLRTYDGRFISYLLERTYLKPIGATDSLCQLTTVAEGWLSKTDDTHDFKVLEPHVMLSDCDWKAIQSLRPIGTIELEGNTFLIGRHHGYESRQEVVVELNEAPSIIARGHWQGPGD